MTDDKVKWISGFFWICEKHFRSERMTSSEGGCRIKDCASIRPKRESFLHCNPKDKIVILKNDDPVSTVPEEEDYCGWVRCNRDNGKRAFKRPTSMYCSDACRKAKARAAYRERKKAENGR
jgi:hypothetical protein